ncbi:MAG TPA: Dabb family protein [Dinghuibacter sp.]|uniref:Dabb family protein n=1 Tax=Dinghuibacter sp. TaxID=2024697 RepID=UPI002BDAA975|nr:Dabb family protein [Dinghuibacter sp.]HTJ14774.1 Dabb family protein [Dinghuibacter sp.]
MEFSKQFVHHVYFWLNRPESTEDRARLIEGLRTLVGISTIKSSHIGVPAGTSRDVVDGSYAVSWLAVFDDRAGQDAYQVDPVHLKFVEDCSHLWTRVVVYDSVMA